MAKAGSIKVDVSPKHKSVSTWGPSVNDCLAEDWEVIE